MRGRNPKGPYETGRRPIELDDDRRPAVQRERVRRRKVVPDVRGGRAVREIVAVDEPGLLAEGKCSLSARDVDREADRVPILAIEDAATAYTRAIEANYKLSGIFNIASGNYTVGEVADLVRSAVEERLAIKVNLHIKHIQDFRNYKVSTAKASNVLSFHATGDVKSIVGSLCDNMDRFKDWDNPLYSNIQSLKKLEAAIEVHSLTGAIDR